MLKFLPVHWVMTFAGFLGVIMRVSAVCLVMTVRSDIHFLVMVSGSGLQVMMVVASDTNLLVAGSAVLTVLLLLSVCLVEFVLSLSLIGAATL